MPKRTVVDTSSTSPAEFLSGSGQPVEIPPGTPTPSPETPIPATPPETAPVPEPTPATTPPPVDTPQAPAAQPEQVHDPFVLIQKWEGGKVVIPATATAPQKDVASTLRTLRGMNVNGGVVLRLSALHLGQQLVESICFVPDSFVNKDGKLVPPPAI